MALSTSPTAQALKGIRVLDLGHVMAGPFCAMLLCDMGADVIKVEAPGGDPARRMSGSQGTESPAFNAVNRGKRGIVVDLKTQDGSSILRRLISTADILIENFRPGVMRQLGLDYNTIRTLNPKIIYASISGYGQSGPDSAKGGFDLIAQGESGIISVTGEAGRPPVKAGIPLTDLGAALFALGGILAALHHRVESGRGQHIDTSLFEAGVALSVWESSEYFAGTDVLEPLGSAHRLSAPYQAIRCADGYITLGAANDRLFHQLCDLLDHPEWTVDPAFANNTARVKNQRDLGARIELVTISSTCAHWLTALEERNIPCGRINTYREVFESTHVKARKMVVDTDHPTLGRIRTLGTPLKLSETPLLPGRPAPLLGQHTGDVLAEVGFSKKEIVRFRTAEIVK